MAADVLDPLAAGDDLRAFVDASPTPWHAVAEMARRLRAAGFSALDEGEAWTLAPTERRFVVRGASLVALVVGSAPAPAAGVRAVGAHTDSPGFRVRPRHDVRQAGYRLLGVETYGGLLAHTWLDRELTVAGRLVTADGAEHLAVLPGAPLRLPSLAIHLDRSVREGLVLDPQRHLVPVWGLDGRVDPGAATDGAVPEPTLVAALAQAAGVEADDVLGHDLALVDTQPAARTGADGTWLAAPRLDDLACCHSALTALLGAGSAPATQHTQLFVANDHEEVGSGSATGARGTLLADVLARVVEATSHAGTSHAGTSHAGTSHAGPGPGGGTGAQDLARTLARSRLVSADMAHAVHPTRPERHEPAHAPVLGGGPVLKVNANQAYATDAATGAWFTGRCRSAGVPVQHFVSRGDLPCGSTIGPLSATRTGIATVDVGAPMLAMHSCRELASARDVPLMVAALGACLADA